MKKRKKVTVKVKPIEQKQKLTLKQEAFCELYVMADKEFFGNGVATYIEVYDPDQSNKNWYKLACSAASQILSNTKVCERINQLLEDGGLNDQFVDKQLLFMITQHADGNMKLGALREYNKLKQRIIERQDVTSKGQRIETKEISYDEFMKELLKKNG